MRREYFYKTENNKRVQKRKTYDVPREETPLLQEPRQRDFKHGHREVIADNSTWYEFCLGTVDDRNLWVLFLMNPLSDLFEDTNNAGRLRKMTKAFEALVLQATFN